MNEQLKCFNCEHFNCYHDGTVNGITYWDIWCSLPHDIEEGGLNLAPTCKDYKENF